MPKPKRPAEVPVESLRWRCDPKIFPFRTTEKAAPLDGILGQARAVEAIRLGLRMKGPGYNIYVAGLAGTGKTTTVKALLEELARGMKKDLWDVVYVNNFKDPAQPRAILLPAGRGRALEKEMRELVADVRRLLPAVFEHGEFKAQRDQIVERHKNDQRAAYLSLEEDLRRENFALVQVQMGPITRPAIMPLIDGQPVPFEQLESLAAAGNFPEGRLRELKEKHVRFRNRLEEAMRQARAIEKRMKEELADLEKRFGLAAVSDVIDDVRKQFDSPDVQTYLDEVQEEIVGNLARFGEKDESPQVVLPGIELASPADDFSEFEVNVIVDHSETQGPPIVVENAPTHKNLFGTIERVQHRSGNWTTDFTKIRAGSLLRANGGFLVFNLLDAMTESGVWKTLKRTLKSRTFEFETFDPYFFFTATAMKPMPFPIDVKVVAIGDGALYHLLRSLDDEFEKIFKVKADFDAEMERSEEQILKVASFVHKIVTDEGLRHFDGKGLAALVEEAVRLTGRQKKLTTRFSILADLIREADYWAGEAGAKLVSDVHVDRAVAERIHRHSLVEDRVQEMIADGMLLIDTEGGAVGQVNGLALYGGGDRPFARPTRITAQVSMGRAGIVSVEREAKLSGKIHDKGMLILSGFLRARFAQDKPLSLSVSVTFEQSYGGIDGDSASSTEVYAILSQLARVPLRQDLAVTGSVDQMGQIQPIGGVNEKIEGFFDVCRAKGLTGTQGVLIPKQNVGDLMLRKDVVAAVRAGKFHVYPVGTIDEGIEILTGLPAGERRADGTFPPGSIGARVDERLRELAVGLREFDKGGAKRAEAEGAEEKRSKNGQ